MAQGHRGVAAQRHNGTGAQGQNKVMAGGSFRLGKAVKGEGCGKLKERRGRWSEGANSVERRA